MADATENKTTTSDATNTTTTKSISKQDEVKQEQEKFLQQFQQFLQERQVIATTKRPREEDEVVEEDEETDEPDAKRQRLEEEPELYVLLVSYLGTGFFGLQMYEIMMVLNFIFFSNPTTITIESILLMALFKVDGAVPKTKRFMKSKLGGFGWQRSCRTDKGVHAIRNIVTCKMYPSIAERADFCDLVNAHLPDKIRVMCMLYIM